MDKQQSDEPRGVFDWGLIILFAVIVAIMAVSIFYRYVLNSSLSWSDEAIRFAFVWFTLLGAAVVFRDNAHIRIDFFLAKMPAPMRSFVGKGERIMIVGLYIFFMVAGMVWVFSTQGTQMSSMRLPLNWFFYFALPATSAAALYFALFNKSENSQSENNGK